MEESATALPYEIDGNCHQSRPHRAQNELASPEKPRAGRLPISYAARGGVTQIEGVLVTVGRTGKLTPTAMLKPVAIAAPRYKPATLHNMDFIDRLGVKIATGSK